MTLDKAEALLHCAVMSLGKHSSSRVGRCVLAALAASLVIAALPGFGDETDNFRLPLDVDMADLGDYLDVVHMLALEGAVNEVNADIEQALKVRDANARAKRLAALHKPETLAGALDRQFGLTVFETRAVDAALKSAWAHQTYPGLKTSHHSIRMNFTAKIPLDLRIMCLFVQAPTVRAYDVYFGTDKLTHFHHLGWSYYKMYRSLRAAGVSEEEAYRKVIYHHAEGGLLAEGNCYGRLGTGVYSNGDMAANYLGFKFFLNLTEPVMLERTNRPPLAVRCGVFWRINDQVRPDSGWFRPFISDHWNEALNPCYYDWTMRAGIRRVLRHRARDIVQFYTRKAGRPAEAAYYDNLARELSTYYGEPYGYYGQLGKLMTIGNTCLPALNSAQPR
ncbi:MAG TPA: hypothetical protein VMU04_13440 [Candidatus Acidoferrum sp.]|nr:hypothetical protein [Candidatus Acidoferrum sp.]